MKFKPDEKMLVSYLYGELDRQEREKVEAYLLGNSQTRKELEQMHSMRQLLANIEDKEVHQPIFVHREKESHYRHRTFLRYMTGFAASLLIILLAGKLTDARISISGSELRMGFGDTAQAPEPNAAHFIHDKELDERIKYSLSEYDQQLQEQWSVGQEKLEERFEEKLQQHSTALNHLINTAALDSDKRLTHHMERLQLQNAGLIEDYWQEAAAMQKQYMDEILIGFAINLQQMREEDLIYLQSRLNYIENDKNQFQYEMEQIMAELIMNVGNIEHR